MKNKSYVFFSLRCRKAEVAEVTRQMGMEPTEVKVVGIRDSSNPEERVELHLWNLVSALPESANVNRHVEHLIEVLTPGAETIRSMTESREGGIHCQITYHRPPCPAEISVWAPMVQALAKMGLSLTYDVFFNPEQGWNDDAPIECY